MIRTVLNNRAVIWGLLYFPLALQLWWFATGETFYGEILHWTGVQSTRLLIVVIAVTPIRRLFHNAGWSSWLLRRRRDLGVATFSYAAVHTAIYLNKQESLRAAMIEGLEVPILTGWIASLVFLVLALTSNNYSVRKLRGWWKTLHQLVYLGAGLTFAHWILTAFDPAAGYLHFGIVLVLISIRVALSRRKGA